MPLLEMAVNQSKQLWTAPGPDCRQSRSSWRGRSRKPPQYATVSHKSVTESAENGAMGKEEYELETGLKEQLAESSPCGHEANELGHSHDFGLQTRTLTCAQARLVPPSAHCQSHSGTVICSFRGVSWPHCQHLPLCWMMLLGLGVDFPTKSCRTQASYKNQAGGPPLRRCLF